MGRRQILPLGIQSAIFTIGVNANQSGWEPATFESHGPAAVG
jgi:hypothetical protein